MADPQPGSDDWVVLGRITRTQGHHGAVRLLPFFEPPERIEQLPSRQVHWQPAPAGKLHVAPSRAPRRLTIETIRYHKQFVILTFEEVPDMTAAEAITQGEIAVRRGELWPMEEGQFFAFDLVGLDVFDAPTQRIIGIVEALVPGGAQDLLRVRKTGGSATFLIPFVRPLVVAVTLETGRVTVALPPGLDEL